MGRESWKVSGFLTSVHPAEPPVTLVIDGTGHFSSHSAFLVFVLRLVSPSLSLSLSVSLTLCLYVECYQTYLGFTVNISSLVFFFSAVIVSLRLLWTCLLIEHFFFSFHLEVCFALTA